MNNMYNKTGRAHTSTDLIQKKTKQENLLKEKHIK